MSPPARPSFATPLPQSPRSDTLEWRLPRPYDGYVLTGRSRAAWHTSFVVPQLNLVLDAGLCVSRLRPKHVFLTHGHSDHTLLAPAFVARHDPPDVYCPAEVAGLFDDFVRASTSLDRGGADAECAERQRPDTHVTHGVRHGDVVALRRLKGITATVFACDHSVPCVGYVFSTTTHRLQPRFSRLAGPELQALRRSGVVLTEPHHRPIFAFLGDTTTATLAAAPDWLRHGIPVVITECSFLYPEHKALADRTKHTAWCDLESVVRMWPQTTFVLIHFSMRYSERDIAAFFSRMRDPPSNIVVWADPQA